jgi:hypothetical protein
MPRNTSVTLGDHFSGFISEQAQVKWSRFFVQVCAQFSVYLFKPAATTLNLSKPKA